MAAPEFDFRGMSRSTRLFCPLSRLSSPLLGLLLMMCAFTTACRQYAVQSGLLPSSADVSEVSKLAVPLQAVLVQRPVQTNSKPKRTATAFSTKKPYNLLALFIQLSGQESKQRCRTCREDHGRWAECVVSSQPDVQRATGGCLRQLLL